MKSYKYSVYYFDKVAGVFKTVINEFTESQLHNALHFWNVAEYSGSLQKRFEIMIDKWNIVESSVNLEKHGRHPINYKIV